jgi:hypothetical protein
MTGSETDPKSWFEDEELATCPTCAEKSLVGGPDGMTYCFGCGATERVAPL